jgi:hypothetical protein
VIHNRSRRDKVSLDSTVLKPWQFSSFNANDPNATRLPNRNESSNWKAWLECAELAEILGSSDYRPRLPSNCYHYHDTSIAPPKWAQSMKECARIGAFIFYV